MHIFKFSMLWTAVETIIIIYPVRFLELDKPWPPFTFIGAASMFCYVVFHWRKKGIQAWKNVGEWFMEKDYVEQTMSNYQDYRINFFSVARHC